MNLTYFALFASHVRQLGEQSMGSHSLFTHGVAIYHVNNVVTVSDVYHRIRWQCWLIGNCTLGLAMYAVAIKNCNTEKVI